MRAVLAELNRTRLSYAITGAAAASYYGRARTTADVDFVVSVTGKGLPRFIRAVEGSGLRVDVGRVKRQLETGCNVIRLPDKRSQYRADFIIQQGRIERRKGSMLGLPAYYQQPEPLILAKLRMIKATLDPERSLKDKNDIIAILATTKVNTQSIRRIARRESTLEMFEKVIEGRKNRRQDQAYPEDPIFKNVERGSKPGRKNRVSTEHDKILYSKRVGPARARA